MINDIPSGRLKLSCNLFNLFLSNGFEIFFDTPPVEELFGNKTLYLPGKDIKVVTAAPFVPLSSLTI